MTEGLIEIVLVDDAIAVAVEVIEDGGTPAPAPARDAERSVRSREDPDGDAWIHVHASEHGTRRTKLEAVAELGETNGKPRSQGAPRWRSYRASRARMTSARVAIVQPPAAPLALPASAPIASTSSVCAIASNASAGSEPMACATSSAIGPIPGSFRSTATRCSWGARSDASVRPWPARGRAPWCAAVPRRASARGERSADAPRGRLVEARPWLRSRMGPRAARVPPATRRPRTRAMSGAGATSEATATVTGSGAR